MNIQTPPLLIGAALLFWGWQTGNWLFAVPMALLLEGSRFIRFRWDFSVTDFNRLSDLCALIVIGIVFYLLLTERSIFIIFILLQWLPVAFFPLILSQRYSMQGRVDLRAMSLIFRKRDKNGQHSLPTALDISYPYFALCILSAGFGNVRSHNFYVGMLVLAAWALWRVRPRHTSPVIWALVFLMACYGGFVGHVGLHGLQQFLETKGLLWFYDLGREDADPYQSVTGMNHINALKPSSRVMFRVRTETPLLSSLLLREASYTLYNDARWFALRPVFQPVPPELDGTTWTFAPPEDASSQVTVSARLTEGTGMLKLPAGTVQVAHLPVQILESNPFGAVRVEDGPGLVTYRARYGPRTPLDSPPQPSDRVVPEGVRPAIAGIVDEMELRYQTPEKVIRALEFYFFNRFRYSLSTVNRGEHDPLVRFLTETRSGHCEHFASATVLMLREAGIPARYATGYSVHEWNSDWGWYLVRTRHAHAWTIAWVNGRWIDVDTTPPDWRAMEDEAASPFQGLMDLWSRITFLWNEWRWQEQETAWTGYLIWALVPLGGFLLLRIYAKRNIRRLGKAPVPAADRPVRQGSDSPFYRVETRLVQIGFHRQAGEPLLRWIDRIEAARPDEMVTDHLRRMADYHYRYRFGPEGLPEAEKKTFTRLVEQWLVNRKQGISASAGATGQE